MVLGGMRSAKALTLAAICLTLATAPACSCGFEDMDTPTSGPSDPAGEPVTTAAPEPVGETGAAVEPEKPAE